MQGSKAVLPVWDQHNESGFKQSFGISEVSNAVQTVHLLMLAVGVKDHTFIIGAVSEQTPRQCSSGSAMPTCGRPAIVPESKEA